MTGLVTEYFLEDNSHDKCCHQSLLEDMMGLVTNNLLEDSRRDSFSDQSFVGRQ